MLQIIAVGVGSFFGGISRYIFGVIVVKNISISFPIATLFINIFGCLLFGLLVNHELINDSNLPLKEFLLIGFLGGFTTFSAFSYEFLFLFQRNQVQTAIIYSIVSIILGGLAVYIGSKLNQIYSN